MKTTFLQHLLEQSGSSIPQVPEDLNLQINGIGHVAAGQAHSHVVSMLNDLTRRAQSGNVDWNTIKWALEHSALLAYVNALAAAQKPQ